MNKQHMKALVEQNEPAENDAECEMVGCSPPDVHSSEESLLQTNNSNSKLNARRSPRPVHRHKRSVDSLYTSSQESLNMTSAGKDCKDDSTDDSRDEGRSSAATCRMPRNPCIEEVDESRNLPCHEVSFILPVSENGFQNNFKDDNESLEGSTASDISQKFQDTEKKSERNNCERRIEKTPDRTDLTRPNSRERSFEKSLDNVMEKISERSYDLSAQLDKSSCSDIGRQLEEIGSPGKPLKVEKKRKSSSWYSVLNPTYKSRSEDFKKIFKEIPNDERLIVDYSCALQKDILVHGRMFISQNWVCFYANIFRWETMLTIQCKDITAVTKEKTARVIPNAIQITTEKDKFFFTSFGTRDKTFMMLFRIWQNALLDQPMTSQDLWYWVHMSYGEELGLTSSDDDYVPPPGLDGYLPDHHPKEDENHAKFQDPTDSSDPHPLSELNHTQMNADDTDVMATDDVFNQSQASVDSPIGVDTAEVQTDFGDTTEESDGEIICTEHDHLTKTYMNEVFSIPVDKMFEHLFTDSSFFRHLAVSRKTFDMVLPPWQEEPDSDGNRLRTITYTLTLSSSIGPKSSPTTEKQICYKQSQPGVLYVIDTITTNAGIPYAESFYVVNRYCVTRVSRHKCRVKITSEVKYKKSVWGLVKNLIEKNAAHGISDYFQTLALHLRNEAEKQEQLLPNHHISKKKILKKRRQLGSSSDVPASRPSDSKLSTQLSPVKSKNQISKDDKMIKLNGETMIRIVCFMNPQATSFQINSNMILSYNTFSENRNIRLVLLVLFNAVLFYKLWSLENYANTIYFPYFHQGLDSVEKFPHSKEEWSDLLKQQHILHQSEIERWKDVLSSAVVLIDQVKHSLTQLQESLHRRQQAS